MHVCRINGFVCVHLNLKKSEYILNLLLGNITVCPPSCVFQGNKTGSRISFIGILQPFSAILKLEIVPPGRSVLAVEEAFLDA